VEKVKESKMNFPFKKALAFHLFRIRQYSPKRLKFIIPHLKKQLKERAYLIKRVMFQISNKKNNDRTAYFFDGGILSLINDLNRGKKILHEAIFINKQVEDKEVEVAIHITIQWRKMCIRL